MENKRRSFLKFAGVSVLGLGSLSLLEGLTSDDVIASSGQASAEATYKKTSTALTAERWGMVIDTKKLSSRICHKMEKACHEAHNVPDHENKNHEIKWIWDAHYKHVFPNKTDEFLQERLKDLPIPVLCNHCANPPCVQACPTQATFQREDGIVLMDFHRCIGCRFCMAACPYGSRSFNFRDPREAIKPENENKEFPTRTKGVVEKCNFCAERLAVGKQPACVEASKGALIFGDLGDPQSEVRQLLKENYAIRRKQNLGSNPSVYYLV
ncbi:MAG: 4Fe-4S dicluster domain-containing protein [Desulfobacteraceae bacterium]|jgi:Fe-S-cluster-containing dehydrogenase component|nr:4Fe-4S dicluster domain-containing protein [Desulfobacteraceae bacterium]